MVGAWWNHTNSQGSLGSSIFMRNKALWWNIVALRHMWVQRVNEHIDASALAFPDRRAAVVRTR